MAAQASAEDANLDGWVPSLDHATFQDWNLVYEPSEDTFLLLDALFADRAALRTSRVIVEIGPGSGVVSTYLAKLTSNKVLAVDINEAACALTQRTAAANGARRRRGGNPRPRPWAEASDPRRCLTAECFVWLTVLGSARRRMSIRA